MGQCADSVLMRATPRPKLFGFVPIPQRKHRGRGVGHLALCSYPGLYPVRAKSSSHQRVLRLLAIE